jgi:hypothetical protein
VDTLIVSQVDPDGEFMSDTDEAVDSGVLEKFSVWLKGVRDLEDHVQSEWDPEKSGFSPVTMAMMTDFAYCLIQQVTTQAEANGGLPVTPVINCPNPGVLGSLF